MNDLAIKSRWELPIPAPKEITRDERIDELIRDGMFRSWDWVDALHPSEANNIILEVTHACWRGDYKSEAERLAAIKLALEGYITHYAETEADHED